MNNMEDIVMNNAVGVKLTYDGQMRRFPLNGTSFVQFYEQIVSLLGLPKTAELVLKYTDEEGDLITLSSDLELRSAIVPGQLLRVAAALKGAAPPIPTQPVHPPAFAHAPPAGNLYPHVTATQYYHPPTFAPEQPQFYPTSAFMGNSRQAFDGPNEMHMYKKMEKKHGKHMKKAEKMHKMERKHHEKHEKRMHHCHDHSSQAGDKFVARFVADVTVEDGTAFQPRTAFLKTWRVRNEGQPWPAGSRLQFVGKASDNMNAPPYVLISDIVGTMQEINISVPMVAPEKPGRYTAYFRMCTPDGKKFGQRVWASVVVVGISGDSSSSDGEREADKYEALVDVVLRNEVLRSAGVKRHHIFRLIQKCDGDIDKVNKKLEKKLAKHAKKCRKA